MMLEQSKGEGEDERRVQHSMRVSNCVPDGTVPATLGRVPASQWLLRPVQHLFAFCKSPILSQRRDQAAAVAKSSVFQEVCSEEILYDETAVALKVAAQTSQG